MLFADIVGSTQLIAGLDPEQAMEILRPPVAAMSELVRQFSGTLMATMGDGVMALFGAPRAQEGHALLACRAALAIQAAFPRGEGAIMVRIGLHSGEVVLRVFDSDPSKEQIAHGLTVHLASRVQQMAEQGGICLTEDTFRLVRPYCDARSLGHQMVKGLSEPIEIYRLLGLKPAVASQQFIGTNLTAFRGRDHELTLLKRALRRTENGDARVIGISAPPGVGKSRLCYEFAEWCRGRHIPVLEARALIYGHATPLQPVLELLRLFFGISSTEDSGAARAHIAERLMAMDTNFESDLPILNDFLGVADAENPPPHLDPKGRQARLRLVVQHIARQVGLATSVIIIEDLHWLDEASEDFVETLINSVAGTRTMLVLNYRPSYAAYWMKRDYYQELPLRELSPAQTIAMVEELIGGRPELRQIGERIAERSGGNPFFAEELIRSLVEKGVLLGESGNFLAGTKAGEETLPATVQAVIGARIDRLGDPAKAVLQIGAIIGKEFPLVVLEQVSGMAAGEIERILDSLCETELIQEQTGGEHRGFAFRHPLIQEVVYATQLKARRTELHAAVARAMETFHKDRIEEFAGLLAYHYEAAGDFLQGANHWARAAMWVGKTNSAEGLRHWTKVRLLLYDQPRSKPRDALHALACGQIMNFGWREGMAPEQAKPFADEALSLAGEVGDRTLQTHILAAYGRICAATGAADDYVSSIKKALSLISGESQAGRYATLNAILSQAYTFAGRLNEALAANTIALQGVSHIETVDHQILGFNVESWIMCLRGRNLILLGRFAEAEDWLSKVLRFERGQLDPVIHYIPHAAYVDIAWCRRDPSLAEHHASRVTEIAEQSAIPYLQVYAQACTGVARNVAGDFAGAVRSLEQALDFARRSKVGLEYEARMVADLAEGHYYGGDAERAIVVAREAIEIARRRTTRFAECHASIICAGALVLANRATRRDEAERLFRRADDLIQVSGARIYEPLLARERARL